MLEPWQQRVVEEKGQLDSRIDRLEKYINESAFPGLSPVHQSLMRVQLDIMNAYSNILTQRIKLFEPAPVPFDQIELVK